MLARKFDETLISPPDSVMNFKFADFYIIVSEKLMLTDINLTISGFSIKPSN